jgi:hypothetical protein
MMAHANTASLFKFYILTLDANLFLNHVQTGKAPAAIPQLPIPIFIIML